MKNFKFYYLCVFACMGVLITSCGDDEDDENNTITITIEEPVNGETITDCADVHIHVDIEASVEKS